MNIQTVLILALGLVMAAPGELFSQPGYMRKPSYREKSNEEAPEPKSRRRRREEKVEEPVEEPAEEPVGVSKESIEAYLQKRLNKLKKVYEDQDAFGLRRSGAWKNFWLKRYEERKLFEVRVARQRLNLFESLASLDPSYHGQTIADFERLQDNVIKSFESQQKEKMDEFFAGLTRDIEEYAKGQERIRADFLESAIEAWKSQKSASRD
ncbi:MAG: hypothetical protein ABII00_00715 [Elusimicrobiota bacterium]